MISTDELRNNNKDEGPSGVVAGLAIIVAIFWLILGVVALSGLR